jgi:hypothetical protein
MARIDGLFGDDSMWRMEIWSSSYFIVSIGRWGLDLNMVGNGVWGFSSTKCLDYQTGRVKIGRQGEDGVHHCGK